MDVKLILATFTAVFLAEMADKTQLVGIGMASKSGKPFSVFLGSVGAYMMVTALSVLVGAALSHHVRPEYIRMAGGTVFIAVGLLIIFNKI